jgi:hypothetical protein
MTRTKPTIIPSVMISFRTSTPRIAATRPSDRESSVHNDDFILGLCSGRLEHPARKGGHGDRRAERRRRAEDRSQGRQSEEVSAVIQRLGFGYLPDEGW